MNFYDRFGQPIAYSTDSGEIFLFNGLPVAYIFEDAIYSYQGVQYGWILNNWIRDLNGYAVFFNELSFGFGPMKPMRRMLPMKAMKRMVPMKSMRRVKRAKPVLRMQWSPLSGLLFFEQR